MAWSKRGRPERWHAGSAEPGAASARARDPAGLSRRASTATEIIDREKPAHTYYGLFIGSPSLQIADPPTFDSAQNPLTGVFVGVTTLIGTTRFTSS